MADCSAAGTTIDRAARVVLGNSNQEAVKHVGALFGHAATAAGPAVNMPMAAPEHLAMPGAHAAVHSHGPVAGMAPPNTMDAVWKSQPHAAPMPQQMMYPPPQQMALHPYHQQQHQAMAQAAFQQQQQHMMQQQMMQQQQVMAAQQMQQQNLKPAAATTQIDTGIVQDDLGHWHEGLEEAAEAEGWKPEEEEVLGHEGNAPGASVEELAAAWAQAEAEFEQSADELEDHANMWTGEQEQVGPSPYEFINKTEGPQTDGFDWMDQGMRQFRDGEIKEAVRSFEMELQQNNADNATAWRMLGRCHAENDMDPEAIKCLEAAVDRDPYSPESLLALGVSYVNELNHARALENMKAWLTHNPKYAGIELPPDIYGSAAQSQESAFDDVRKLLHMALEADPTEAGEVHEALGVIYNVNKDYDSAAASFRKALESRPQDYQLWNKLGATLANGSQSDRALPAYHEALKLKPKYARAWLNMAISHSNLQDHDEAARCYLQTLSLNPGAVHCWTYLRMALSSAERWDLLPLVFSQDLNAFKEHFDFVLY